MTRAPNEKGSLLHEPIPKLGRAQQYHSRLQAQACPHVATVTERMPVGHVHFSRVKCRSCGAFLRWLPRPQTIERRQWNAFRLAKLSMCAGLDPWSVISPKVCRDRKSFRPGNSKFSIAWSRRAWEGR
jgi:hypothetical protein